MLLFSTSQLQVTVGNGSATWTTVGNPNVGDLTEITVTDDDTGLERAELYFGNETGAASTVTASDDPSILNKEIYLGDLDPANENNDPWGDTTDEFYYNIAGYNAAIAKIVVYDGTGSRSDPANYAQYYTIHGPEADAALQALLTTGTLNTGIGGDTSGLLYSDFATAVCYAAGTRILTGAGEVPVETLTPGETVLTLDHGPQEILWTRRATQPLHHAAADQKPVLVRAQALARGIPRTDLIISPPHRILVGGRAQLKERFPTEALAPAKALASLPGIRHLNGRLHADWVHFACRRHEIVRANGCWSESLLLGPMALNAMTPRERAELHRLFGPATGSPLNGPPARPLLTVQATRRLVPSRHRHAPVAAHRHAAEQITII